MGPREANWNKTKQGKGCQIKTGSKEPAKMQEIQGVKTN